MAVPDGVSDDALLLGPRPPPAEVASVGGQLDADPHGAAAAPDHLHPAGLEGGQTGGRGRGGQAVRQAGPAGWEVVRSRRSFSFTEAISKRLQHCSL